MAIIHDFKKPNDIKFDRDGFKNSYKHYLLLESDKIKDISEEELNRALDTECESVLELMPEDGLDSLYSDSTCKLCSDDGDVRYAELYATTDLGHDRETQYPGNLFGTKHGYALPVFISCCKRCRRNHRLVSFLPTVIGIFIAFIGFILMCTRSIREPLMAVFNALPLLVYLGIVGLSMLICALVRRFLLDKLGEKTLFNIFEIDKLRYMKAGGWVNLHDENNLSKLMFRNDLPEYMKKPLHADSAADSAATTEDI